MHCINCVYYNPCMNDKPVSVVHYFAHEYTVILFRLQSANRQLDELRSNQEAELGHLHNQLERSTSRTVTLEKELKKSTRTKERLDQEVKGLKEELWKK